MFWANLGDISIFSMHVLHGILHFIDKIAVSKVLEMDKCQNITPYQNERSTQDEHTCISQSTYSVTCYTHRHKTSIFINTYPYQYTHTHRPTCVHTQKYTDIQKQNHTLPVPTYPLNRSFSLSTNAATISIPSKATWLKHNHPNMSTHIHQKVDQKWWCEYKAQTRG